ncbi:MAG TPA: hypothetical protein VF157_08725 [Chloroflexota bacterium]
MWQPLVAYLVLVGLRVLLNNRSLRHYLRLPLVERPAPAAGLPRVSVVGSEVPLDYPDLEVVSDPDQATGKWLLFVPLGAALKAEALDRVMRFALEHRVPALSVFLQQRCESFWERVLLPYAYQQSFVSLSCGMELSRDQLRLIRRAEGQPAMVARGERLGSVRVPRVWAELRPRGTAMWLSVLLSALAIPCAAYGLAAGSQPFELAAVVTYVSAVAELALWHMVVGAPLSYAAFQPLAALVFLVLAARPVRAATHDTRRP